MIEIIRGLPENVVAVSVSGEVTGEDYKNVLIPAIEDKIQSTGRFVYFITWTRNSSGLPLMPCWRMLRLA